LLRCGVAASRNCCVCSWFEQHLCWPNDGCGGRGEIRYYLHPNSSHQRSKAAGVIQLSETQFIFEPTHFKGPKGRRMSHKMKAREHSDIALRRHATQKICTGVCKPLVVAIVWKAHAKHSFIKFKTEQKHALFKQTTDKNTF